MVLNWLTVRIQSIEYCIFRKNLFHKNKRGLHKIHHYKSPKRYVGTFNSLSGSVYLTENSMLCKDCQCIKKSLATPLLSFAKTISEKFCWIDKIHREIKIPNKEVTSINLQKGKDQSPLVNEGKNALTYWIQQSGLSLVVPYSEVIGSIFLQNWKKEKSTSCEVENMNK